MHVSLSPKIACGYKAITVDSASLEIKVHEGHQVDCTLCTMLRIFQSKR